ncbi:E3 ubiquitin-protein ligase BRE1A, partial [Sciurus carolinensis]|nr:E3 ubiquitin-protein ligase BRE1A [Sciurus carolinensis]
CIFHFCNHFFKFRQVKRRMNRENCSSLSEFIFLEITSNTDLKITLFSMFLLVYLISLLANLGMIFLIRVDPKLHTPMYFFFSHLSFCDLCYSTAVGPKMLIDIFAMNKSISFLGCAVQFLTFCTFADSECVLLAVMAFDRQSRFSVLYDESLQLKAHLDEAWTLLHGTRGTHQHQVELIKFSLHKNLRTEVIQLEDTLAQLKAQLELAQKKLHDFWDEIEENSVTKEKDMFNFKLNISRSLDISRLQRNLEMTKKPDNVPKCDEILMEEIEDYKACLTCPCCNVRKKDVVLTKCFHVFCFDCVKTCCDTHQSKCPKCNAAFDASGFHRIYIG